MQEFLQTQAQSAQGFSTVMVARDGRFFPETYTNERDTYRINVVSDRWVAYASVNGTGANVMFTPDELKPFCVCSLIEDAYANGRLKGKK